VSYRPRDPGGIVRRGRAKDDGREIGLLALMLGARDELDDLCTHTNTSHAAMAIRPTSASDIRYAVIGFPSKLICGRSLEAIVWGANLIPCSMGPRAVADLRSTPRAGTFARAG
jgi:hypothetical protein